jgi:hypothetical protein
VSGYETSAYGIEWMPFEPEAAPFLVAELDFGISDGRPSFGADGKEYLSRSVVVNQRQISPAS